MLRLYSQISGALFKVMSLRSYTFYSKDAAFALNNTRASLFGLQAEPAYEPHEEIIPTALQSHLV